MSKQYQPQTPFTVPFVIIPLVKQFVNGVNKQSYPEEGKDVYFCSAKAWVGVNKLVDNVSGEVDTLTVDTWFIPELKKNDRIKFLDDNTENNVTRSSPDRNRPFTLAFVYIYNQLP